MANPTSTTVLLVDDSPTVRSVVQVHLTGRNFSYVEADSGERALRLLRLMPIQLVIADIDMPGMDGITFVRQVRADHNDRLRLVPIVLLTANLDAKMRATGLEAGASAFLNKPVSSAKLRECVDELLA